MGEQLYRVTNGRACFGIVVEDGRVVEAAPIAGAIVGRSWAEVRGQFRQAELVPPVGWAIQEGAGGWRCVNKGRFWSTIVYLEKAGGAAKAVEAAAELEERALAEIERRQALCVALREAFSR